MAVDDLPCPRVQLRPRHHARVVHGQQTKPRRVGAPEALVRGLRVLERFDGPVLVAVRELSVASIAHHNVRRVRAGRAEAAARTTGQGCADFGLVDSCKVLVDVLVFAEVQIYAELVEQVLEAYEVAGRSGASLAASWLCIRTGIICHDW